MRLESLVNLTLGVVEAIPGFGIYCSAKDIASMSATRPVPPPPPKADPMPAAIYLQALHFPNVPILTEPVGEALSNLIAVYNVRRR